ncbi:MAG: DNA repair exonuclease [Eubacteriales bacterium]|nr:DNA repair exonuclease [Eubacteriales bacterium]
MRFIHIADVHLGAVPDKGYPWSKKRSEEIWSTFRNIIQETEKEQADLLLIAGDLFHRQPLLRELKEVNYLFGRLSRTQVVWIAGNHDYLRPDSPERTFEWAENVIFLDGRECECVYFRDINTTVYGMSYYQKEIMQPLYDNLVPEGRESCHILLAHGGDAKHIPIDRKRLSQSGFDYIALGHIHKPQALAENRMIYAGALEPIDPNDTGEHGYILGEYRNGKIRTRFVPFAVRSYIHLTLHSDEDMTDSRMREILARKIAEYGSQNIYRVQLTGYRDPDVIFQTDAYGSFGNILEVDDATEPEYDFGELLARHETDVIGRYIQRLLPEETKVKECGETLTKEERGNIRYRALCLGVQALKKRR